MRQCAGPTCIEIFRWSSWDGRDGKFHDPKCKRELEKQAKREQRVALAQQRDAELIWRCPGCNTSKPREEFYNRYTCKECQRSRDREQYAKDPVKFRVGKANSARRGRIGKYLYRDLDTGEMRFMTDVDFDREFLAQQGKCKIPACGYEFTDRAPDVDHDHDSMWFRGLLCHGCNLSIHARHSAAWHRDVADYLGLNA